MMERLTDLNMRCVRGMTYGLSGVTFFLPLWWPLLVRPSWAHPAAWLALLIACLVTLGASVNAQALVGSLRHVLSRPSGFMVSPLVWLVLALLLGALVSVFDPSYFFLRELFVYLGFLLVLMVARLCLQPSQTFDARVAKAAIVGIIGIAFVVEALQINTLYWSGRAVAVTAVFFLPTVLLLRKDDRSKIPLLLLLWSIPLLTESRWAAVCGSLITVLVITRLVNFGRVLKVVLITSVSAVLLVWWNSDALVQRNNAVGSQVSVSSEGCLLLEVGENREEFCSPVSASVLDDVNINTSGRTWKYALVLENLPSNIFMGGGLGASSSIPTSNGSLLGHPHSEPLRVLFDFGIVGFGLIFVFVALAIRRLTLASRGSSATSQWREVGLLSLVSLLLLGIFENFLVFPWIMAPIGLFVGRALRSVSPSGA